MAEKTTIIQKIRKKCPSAMFIAERYYSIISTLNKLHLTNKEIQVLAFIAVFGITRDTRKQYMEITKSSYQTLGNTLGELFKKGILTKEDKNWLINKAIQLDFSKNIALQIIMEHE